MRGWTAATCRTSSTEARQNLLLGGVAEPVHPLVVEVQELSGLEEADGEGVRQQVQRQLGRDAGVHQPLDGHPGLGAGTAEDVERLGHLGQERGDDHVRFPWDEGGLEEGTAGGRHPVPLILAVRRVAELLLEGVARVDQRPHELAVSTELQRFRQVRVLPGREHPLQRGPVVERVAGQPQDVSHRLGDGLLAPRAPVHEGADPALQSGVELGPVAARPYTADTERAARLAKRPGLVGGLEGNRILRLAEEERVDGLDLPDHGRDDLAGLGRDVVGFGEPVVAVEREPRDGVVQVREGPDGKDVPGHLLAALLERARPLLRGASTGREEPVELRLGARQEQGPDARVGRHLGLHHAAIERLLALGQCRDDDALRLHLHVALAHLLRVVEGVGVQHAPDELPAHVLQAELEGGVLEGRVVARLVGLPGNAVANRSGPVVLPHVLRRDDARAVAGARGGHRVVEGLDEAVGEPDDGRGGAEGSGRRHLSSFLHGRPTSRHTP